MSYLAASGVCLAALVGSVIYEKHRLKKEEELIKKTIEDLKQL
ncbi:MAG: hypothetical protein SV487_02445 [Thermodesulfobacteriota bacterium]|nr:hypothetical protein [Thermodesulfobacteriota bacterium]